MTDTLIHWIPTAITAIMAAFVGWRTMRREDKKAQTEEVKQVVAYWKEISIDMRARVEILERRDLEREKQYARLRAAFEYLALEVEAINPTAVRVARDIAAGLMKRVAEDETNVDVTEQRP